MATVKTYVHVHSDDGRQHAALQPGDTVPDWASVTNPAVLGEAAPAPHAAEEPEHEAEHEEHPAPAKRAPRRRKPADHE